MYLNMYNLFNKAMQPLKLYLRFKYFNYFKYDMLTEAGML